MKPTHPRLFLLKLALLTLASSAAAQTATWIAPGTSGGVNPHWHDPANWDTGVVPSGATAVAIINVATNSGHTVPVVGGARPLISTPVTLDALQFALPVIGSTSYAGMTIGSYRVDPGDPASMQGPGSLRLEGEGLIVSAAGTSAYTVLDIYLSTGAVLEFANQSVLARTGFTSLRLAAAGYGSPTYVRFMDDAAIAPGTFNTSHKINLQDQAVLQFQDRARAGDAYIEMGLGGRVDFSGQASAESATMRSASLTDASLFKGVAFRDDATAASADIWVTDLTFHDRATAGAATIDNSGVQSPSGHGLYMDYYARLQFLDQSTAGQAAIFNGAIGLVEFSGHSTAGAATITNRGDLTFGGNSTLGDARIISDHGQMQVNLGYNQAGPAPTGRIFFRDQATGGNGRIEITGADSIIDFSGLHSGGGATGRAALADPANAPTTTADDGVFFSLGSITNTAPGGTIHLGSTVLDLGSDHRDMTLSARIRDGGHFGSLAGEALVGGRLNKSGTGTLTIANPDNDFTGDTTVTSGTLHLAGGTLNRVFMYDAVRLTGTGLIRGDLITGGSGAVVSPGNSPGTLTIGGDYIQSANNALNIEIASRTEHDRLVVGGTAFLSGTLNLSFLNGYVPVGDDVIDFLTASDIQGVFDTVNLPAVFGATVSADVLYLDGLIRLQVEQLSYAGFAGGSAAAARFGAYLDTVLSASGGHALLAELNTLDAATLTAALAALAPDRYGVLAEDAFTAALVHQAVIDRQLSARRSAPQGRGLDLFFEAGHRRATFDAVSGLPSADATGQRGTVGGVWRNEAFLLGATITQENADLDFDAFGSRAEIQRFTPAVFLQYAPDRFFLNASAAFSRDEYELQRRIAYPGANGTALAQPDSRRTDLALTAGYAIPSSAWTFTPVAGVLHTSWKLDGFAETGVGAAGLALADIELSSTRLRAGVEAVRRGKDEGFIPRFSLHWLHELKDDRSYRAGLAGTAATYTVAGREAETDLVHASISLEKRLGASASLNLALSGAWGRNTRLTSDLSAGFRWDF